MFKKGDMVECISKGGNHRIKVGRRYEIRSANRELVQIVIDGQNWYYNANRFKKVTEPKPSPIKTGDTVECVDAAGFAYLTKGNMYKVTKIPGPDKVTVIDKEGDRPRWYYAKRFKKVNKPKQEKAKGECSMICSTVIVTKDKDGVVVAVDDLELSVAKSLGKAVLDRAVKSADKLKDKPNKSVMAVEEKFEGVE